VSRFQDNEFRWQKIPISHDVALNLKFKTAKNYDMLKNVEFVSKKDFL
jgi:hypothetical protein